MESCILCWGLYIVGAYILYKVLDRLLRVPWIGNLSQRYVLVTGCDTGFGHTVALKLDKIGVNVFAACLTEAGETTLKKSSSSKLRTLHLDVSNSDSVRKAFDYIQNNIPDSQGLWGIINNAGVAGNFGPSDWLSVQHYKECCSVNLFGLIDVTTTFLPLLKKTRGRVVNTASIFGRLAIQGNAPYSVSKFGVEAFSDCVRRELYPFGVSAHIIEPGFHKTSMTTVENLERCFRKSWDSAPESVKQDYGPKYVPAAVDAMLKSFLSGVVSEDITPVVDAYIHALLAAYPRARYVVGWDAKLIFLPMSLMPEWMSDWCYRKMAERNNSPKPAASCS